MLQIYDRVIPSRSVPTLVTLTLLAAGLLVALALLDFVRQRILSGCGLLFGSGLQGPAFAAARSLAVDPARRSTSLEPIQDVDRLRAFLSGSAPAALLDLPWVPIYLAAVYLLQPLLGLASVAGAALLVVLTATAETRTRVSRAKAARAAAIRNAFVTAVQRNAETAHALDLGRGLSARWSSLSSGPTTYTCTAAEAARRLSATAKFVRLLLQLAIPGLGALLVVNGEMTAGTIVAASVLTSRALAPIDAGLAHWRSFMLARASYQRLALLLRGMHRETRSAVDLPSPRGSFTVDNLTIFLPGSDHPVVQNLSFALEAGDAIGIIGPTGCGKSTLARALVGVWQPGPRCGSIRMDGAPLSHWRAATFGRHIGYLPQSIDLLPGTVADNIARFEPDAPSPAIVAAAEAAGAHDLIVRLPAGYQTLIGDGGMPLSAGERQLIGLARALYGAPFVVILDEPASHLDGAGENAVCDAITAIRKRGGIAIMIAHRKSAFESIDKILALADGRVQAIGAKDEVFRRIVAVGEKRPRQSHALQQQPAPLPATLKIVADSHGTGSP